MVRSAVGRHWGGSHSLAVMNTHALVCYLGDVPWSKLLGPGQLCGFRAGRTPGLRARVGREEKPPPRALEEKELADGREPRTWRPPLSLLATWSHIPSAPHPTQVVPPTPWPEESMGK